MTTEVKVVHIQGILWPILYSNVDKERQHANQHKVKSTRKCCRPILTLYNINVKQSKRNSTASKAKIKT